MYFAGLTGTWYIILHTGRILLLITKVKRVIILGEGEGGKREIICSLGLVV